MIAKLILLKKSKKEGREYFFIRLTANNKKAYKSVKAPFTPKEWNYDNQKLKNVITKNPDYKEFADNKKWVHKIETKYQDQINELLRLDKQFSFSKVFELVENPVKEVKTLYDAFDARIKEFNGNEKYGTAAGYHGTLNKLKSYHKKDLLFNEVDAPFLIGFSKTMSKLSNATKSIHLRNIRSIYRHAIKKGYALQNDYPFLNEDIWKDTATGYNSRAISKNEIDKIRELKKKLDEGTSLWHACNYFLFGYLGLGINFTDIARLTWENRQNGRISFIRWKTRSKVQHRTSFLITPEMNEIITWYRMHDVQLNNPYIFPVLNSFHDTEMKKYNRIKKIRRQVNKDLKTIGEKIGTETTLTTYVWRHSFASIAKNDLKVSVEMISEMLDHHDLETTKAYYKQYPDADKDKAVAGL